MIIIKKNSTKQNGVYFPLCKKQREITFSFDESFVYEGLNQTDVHKIFGIGILSIPHSFKKGTNKKWWELHKRNSMRLGARWNKELQCIELLDYAYVNGVGDRDATNNNILRADLHDLLYCKISIVKDGFLIYVKNKTKDKFINTFVPCDIPNFYLCMRLRAYMQNVFRKGDIVIKVY